MNNSLDLSKTEQLAITMPINLKKRLADYLEDNNLNRKRSSFICKLVEQKLDQLENQPE